MDLRRIHREQEMLARDPELLDDAGARIADRPESVDAYLRALAHTVVHAADEYLATLAEISEGLDPDRLEHVRSTGSTFAVDLTIRLRELHRAQEDPASQHYLLEITPAERVVGRLAQSFLLLVGLEYRSEVIGLLMTDHELRQMLGEPRVAQWLVDHTDSDPWADEAPDPAHPLLERPDAARGEGTDPV